MSGTPSSRHHLDRPVIQQQGESLLPLHESESITSIPVTPGISQGTYGEHPRGLTTSERAQPGKQEYFPRRPANTVQTPPYAVSPLDDGSFSGPRHGEVALSGTVLSATFTLPQRLRNRKGGKWELEHKYHYSTHLDSLGYLSSKESPWDHTVIAWTGEIYGISDDASASQDELLQSIPASTTASLGGHAQVDGDVITREVFITNHSKATLEERLYHDDIRTLPVWLADRRDFTDDGIRLKQQSRWRRYAERDLCELFHYKQRPPTDGRKADARWDDYHRMNEAFADRICQVYKPGDIVVVHDHYLMLLPELLRERYPDIYIVFFLESPFPTSELVRCLHQREQILKGILGSDLICFQAFHYLILGHAATSLWVVSTRKRVHLSVLPSGINIPKIISLAYTESVNKKYAELKKLYQGKKVIFGCDPMSPFGGVEKKIQAFKCFLDRYPNWQHHVVLVQITSPATMEDDEHDNIFNQAYGSLDFTPTQIHTQKLSQDEYFAVLRLGDVAVNTCVREGISATSLEYVACQQDSHGPLIISEFSGTASNLEEAIRINPWDASQVADQINNALTMKKEQRYCMHSALYKRVVEGNVQICVSSMLRRLIKVLEFGEANPSISNTSSQS
ncbi:hypothetical protein N5P37_011836 [Trichoderma harzianum]|nr:hypothetical protein N5P37_011836 [Trichoderma harzianum]